MGNAVPEETRPAAALISFSIFFEPHFGQAGFSARPTSNSEVQEHASHWNSNSGIFVQSFTHQL